MFVFKSIIFVFKCYVCYIYLCYTDIIQLLCTYVSRIFSSFFNKHAYQIYFVWDHMLLLQLQNVCHLKLKCFKGFLSTEFPSIGRYLEDLSQRCRVLARRKKLHFLILGKFATYLSPIMIFVTCCEADNNALLFLAYSNVINGLI